MAPQIHPLGTLRTLTTEIEAATTLLRAAPDPKPVHRFRTATRRVEAQLELLRLLHNMPDHTAAAGKLARLLRRLRRAAGRVRDLDVQRDLLKQQLPLLGDADLVSSAKDLRKLLKHRRIVATDDLLHTLKRKGPKLATRLETLLTDLGDTDPVLSADELHRLILTWYRDRTAAVLHPSNSIPSPDEETGSTPDQPAPQPPNPTHLHTLRKLAKLARYLAESATPASNPPLTDLADHLHTLQQAGGDWHDALILAKRAQKDLGKRDPLSRLLVQARDRDCIVYQELLSTFQP